MGNPNTLPCPICWNYPFVEVMENGVQRCVCGDDSTSHILVAFQGRNEEEAINNWNRIVRKAKTRR